MEKRRLGKTDLELTTVGLGTWAIGGPWEFGWGPQDDGEAIAAILRAVELGVNWIDTAPAYGCGHSEELVGRALDLIDARPIIATKCGLLWNEKREKLTCLKRDSILRECDASLERLGVDVIDLYQMHWPSPDEDMEEAWKAMIECKQQGKVRHIGVSNFNLDQLKRASAIHEIASLQPPYSMLHREAEDELFDFCREKGLGVLAYSPMQRGLLTGKFSEERLKSLPDDDHRKRHPDFQEPAFSATLELVENLRGIAEHHGRIPAQLAIAWVLRDEVVTAAIAGARRPEQIAETAEASGWKLDDEIVEQIEKLLAERKAKLIV